MISVSGMKRAAAPASVIAVMVVLVVGSTARIDAGEADSLAGRQAIAVLPLDQWTAAFSEAEAAGHEVDAGSVAAIGLGVHDSTIVFVVFDSLGAAHTLTRPIDSTAFARLLPLTARHIELTPPPGTTLRQDGRVYFMIHTTLKASINNPVALAQALPQADARVVTGMAMLSIGGSLYGSYLFTRRMELAYGKVAIMNAVGEAGIGIPRLLGTLVSSQGARTAGEQISAWGSIVGFPLGIWGGSELDLVAVDAYGRAAVMRDFARWSYFYGFLTPTLFSLDKKDYSAVGSSLTMALMPAGFFLGHYLTRDGMSSGRSVLVLVTGTMGMITGVSLPSLFEVDRQKPYTTGALLGHAAGTGVGFLLYPDRTYTFGQGVFIGASAAVGAAFSLAFPLIAMADQHQSYTIAEIVGAWGGLLLGEWLSRGIFDRTSRDVEACGAVFPRNISIPALTQAPLLAADFLGVGKRKQPEREYRLDLLEVRF